MAMWVDAELPEDHFRPVVGSFIRNAPDATPEANPYSEAIRVNHVSSDDVGTPDHINALGTDADIRDTEDDSPSPEVMHAALCFELNTRIWQLFGSFTEYADRAEPTRNYRRI